MLVRPLNSVSGFLCSGFFFCSTERKLKDALKPEPLKSPLEIPFRFLTSLITKTPVSEDSLFQQCVL